MANTLIIRRRIRSVGNVRQITKAMELTAAAKMHKAVEGVLATRPYATRTLQVVRSLETRGAGTHPLLESRPVQKRLIIVITTDKGLAGGLNSQLMRAVINWHKSEQLETGFIVVGKKGNAVFSRLGLPVVASFTDAPATPDLNFTRPISLVARDEFLAKHYDAVYIAYSHFHSTLTQSPTITQLLPFKTHADQTVENEAHLSEALFEPSPQEVLDSTLPRLVDHLVYQIMVESTASEHAARMMAMRNASDNASEVLDDLQLTFNSLRQATITAEIAEISASMAALE